MLARQLAIERTEDVMTNRGGEASQGRTPGGDVCCQAATEILPVVVGESSHAPVTANDTSIVPAS